jgi:hypothetical protein
MIADDVYIIFKNQIVIGLHSIKIIFHFQFDGY